MKSRIELPDSLIELSRIIPSPLYVTGGYVRNSIMGIKTSDIDIAAKERPEDIINLLKGSGFQTVPVNMKLGTLKIIKGGEYYEYTAFRKDSYPKGSGIHKPLNVSFTEDIKEDALRRDFTVNAIYYSVKDHTFVDITGGIEDIKSRVIRAVKMPDEVFSEDGLRLMRMVRFTAELGFSVDESTLESAKKNRLLIKDIAPERIYNELKMILSADQKYGIGGAHIKGIKLLKETGIAEIIFPGLSVSEDIDCANKIRQAVMLIQNDKDSIINALYGIKAEGAEITLTKRLKDLHLRDDAVEVFATNPDIQDILPDFYRAVGRNEMSVKTAEIARKVKKNGLPDRVSALKVKGRDLIALNIKENKRSEILNKLLLASITEGLTSKEEQMRYLREKLWTD
ncbi:MAG: CCA tRNA nucleotidyltransferase [Christensenellales bacterium]|jgi:tRNA nucleotidyltransferase/poly(A) polymerase